MTTLFRPLIIALVTLTIVMAVLYTNTWQGVALALGGVSAPVDEAQRPCYWFEADQQLVCFNEFQTWLGIRDAVPAYVIDHGKFLPMFYDHRRD